MPTSFGDAFPCRLRELHRQNLVGGLRHCQHILEPLNTLCHSLSPQKIDINGKQL